MAGSSLKLDVREIQTGSRRLQSAPRPVYDAQSVNGSTQAKSLRRPRAYFFSTINPKYVSIRSDEAELIISWASPSSTTIQVPCSM